MDHSAGAGMVIVGADPDPLLYVVKIVAICIALWGVLYWICQQEATR